MRARLLNILAVILGLQAIPLPVLPVASAQVARPPLPPPPNPPLPKSPVDQFRELLAATPEQREEFLAHKKPASAALIRTNLKEFDALSANERELRLRMLQLHQHLVPLMQTQVADRAPLLALVPAEDRALLEDRLKAWDALPDSVRQILLADKRSLNQFIQLQRTPTAAKPEFLGTLPEADREAFEAQFKQWLALPEEVRAKTTREFQQFFELSPAEREKTLRRLSDVERRQMGETLRLFASLPAEQRDRCLGAFRRFSGMNAKERGEFLGNAARWRELDPDERAAWRRLVQVLSKPALTPPLPGGRNDILAGTNLPPSRLP